MPYVAQQTLTAAVSGLYGTAGHLLKVWLALKHMGLIIGGLPVAVDTSNSTPSLKRLFSCGASDGRFYIPFAHTPRYLTMKHDASRSVVQTTIQRWGTSGSVVTCDPTGYLDISNVESHLQVATGRRYPLGLGNGESGFALDDASRVSIPITSFAVWFGRQDEIPKGSEPTRFLVENMLRELNVAPSERDLIFLDDDLPVKTSTARLSDKDIFATCEPFIDGEEEASVRVVTEDRGEYERRVRGMVSSLDRPVWMRASPDAELRQLLDDGAKALLLYGPPRTGKTRAIDAIVDRASKNRCTLQIHDGWGYDYLVEGFRPDEDGRWDWRDGPLKTAVEGGQKFIVLEEVNRTAISEALGEVFSLLEETYRGKKNAILLRSGRSFWIPDDVVFIMAMNTVDKSTEDVDDALLGRVAAVEFPPRAEDLSAMLTASAVPERMRRKLADLFASILTIYPLGHGYFQGLRGDVSNDEVLRYYRSRIRPVLGSYLGALKSQELAQVDNLVDEAFAKAL